MSIFFLWKFLSGHHIAYETPAIDVELCYPQT